MKELEIIEEALNIASQRGVFNLQDAAKVSHCLGVIKSKLAPPPEKVEGKPAKVLTK